MSSRRFIGNSDSPGDNRLNRVGNRASTSRNGVEVWPRPHLPLPQVNARRAEGNFITCCKRRGQTGERTIPLKPKEGLNGAPAHFLTSIISLNCSWYETAFTTGRGSLRPPRCWGGY